MMFWYSASEGGEGGRAWMGNKYGRSGPIDAIEDLAIGVVEVFHFSDKFDYFFALAMSLRAALQFIHELISLLDEKLRLFLLRHEHGGREFGVPGS